MIQIKIKKLFGYTVVQCLLIFGVVFIAFTPLHIKNSFQDPDSFYHARISTLMLVGPVTQFPWLPFTTLSDTFADHHLLYHIILIPFVTVLDPLVGISLATLLFTSLFCMLFFLFLKKLLSGLRSPHLSSWTTVWLFLLLSHSLFAFRLNLAKVPVFSLILLILFLWALYSMRRPLIFLLSFLYVWAYAAWPIALIVTTCASLSQSITTAKKIFYPSAWHLVWISGLGVIAGLSIHPSFPSNLGFYWIQIGLIGFLEPTTAATAVNEWSSFGFAIIPRLAISLILFILASVALFIPSSDSWFLKNSSPLSRWYQYFLWFSSCIFLLLSFKAIRHTEYFIPLSLLFSGSLLIPLVAKHSPVKWLLILLQNIRFSKQKNSTLIILLILFIPCIIGANIIALYTPGKGIPFSRFKTANAWLVKNTPKNSIIFHDRWDDFPMLFYYNQHNRYISGLHPNFLGIKDTNMLWDYHLIMEGLVPSTIHTKFFDSFQTEVIFVNTSNKKLISSLNNSSGFQKVYEDNDALIYKKRVQ